MGDACNGGRCSFHKLTLVGHIDYAKKFFINCSTFFMLLSWESSTLSLIYLRTDGGQVCPWLTFVIMGDALGLMIYDCRLQIEKNILARIPRMARFLVSCFCTKIQAPELLVHSILRRGVDWSPYPFEFPNIRHDCKALLIFFGSCRKSKTRQTKYLMGDVVTLWS